MGSWRRSGGRGILREAAAHEACTVHRGAVGAVDVWMASVLLDEPCARTRGLLRELTEAGIGVRPLWRPLHRQPAFGGAAAYRVEVADRLYTRGLSLPCSVGITPEERQAVVDALVTRLV